MADQFVVYNSMNTSRNDQHSLVREDVNKLHDFISIKSDMDIEYNWVSQTVNNLEVYSELIEKNNNENQSTSERLTRENDNFMVVQSPVSFFESDENNLKSNNGENCKEKLNYENNFLETDGLNSNLPQIIDSVPHEELIHDENVSSQFSEKESDDDGITLSVTRKKDISGKRIYDKAHSCLYCQRKIFKITRHIELVHKDVADVAKLLALPLNSKTRINGFQLIVREGDFYHNLHVLSTKSGNLLLTRRPSEREQVLYSCADYMPCPYCLGFLLRTSICRHIKFNCPAVDEETEESTYRKLKSYQDIRKESEEIMKMFGELNAQNFKDIVKSTTPFLTKLNGAFLLEKRESTYDETDKFTINNLDDRAKQNQFSPVRDEENGPLNFISIDAKDNEYDWMSDTATDNNLETQSNPLERSNLEEYSEQFTDDKATLLIVEPSFFYYENNETSSEDSNKEHPKVESISSDRKQPENYLGDNNEEYHGSLTLEEKYPENERHSFNKAKEASKIRKRRAKTHKVAEKTQNDDDDDDDDDEDEITLSVTKKRKKGGKRVYDKFHSCLYCKIKIYKITRHMESKHKDEIKVAKLITLPIDCKARINGFQLLVREGDFYHNLEVISSKSGALFLTRRPCEQEQMLYSHDDYIACPYCLGFLLRTNISKHIKCNCPAIDDESEDSKTKKSKSYEEILFESDILMGTFKKVDEKNFKRDIMSPFVKNKNRSLCLIDPLILKFGTVLYMKFNKPRKQLVKAAMKLLAKLLIEMKKFNGSIKTLSDCIAPTHFETLIQAVKTIKRSEEEICNTLSDKKSNSLRIDQTLRMVAAIERGMAFQQLIENPNYTKKVCSKISSFLHLMDTEWDRKLSTNDFAKGQERELSANDLLPLTKDLMRFKQKLDETIEHNVSSLDQELTYKNWNNLAESVLCSLMLINKTKSEGASQMRIDQFHKRSRRKEEMTKELQESMTPLEQQLAKRLAIVEVQVKEGYEVGIFIDEKIINAMNYLNNSRDKIEVIVPENPYIFPAKNSLTTHLEGSMCLKNECRKANLGSFESIVGNELCKYVSTVSQIFYLSENEADWLAKQTGHNDPNQRQFYQLKENTVQLTKISRILLQTKDFEHSDNQLKNVNFKDPLLLESEVQDNEENDENLNENTSDSHEEEVIDGVTQKHLIQQ